MKLYACIHTLNSRSFGARSIFLQASCVKFCSHFSILFSTQFLMSVDMASLSNSSPEALVYQTLRGAVDSDSEIVKKAESQLREWEQQPGFFSILAQVGTNLQVETNVRWIAIVVLKNAAGKHWRRGPQLAAEEKQQIRQILLTHCDMEPVPQVALQIAVLMGQIARIDYPNEWPQLLQHLMHKVQGTLKTQGVPQYRILLVLLYVVKALASNRSMIGKRIFEELTNNIFEFMHQLWQDLVQSFFAQLDQLSQNTSETLERALLAVRLLRKLTTFGFHVPHTHKPCMDFVEQLFVCIQRCIETRYELKHKYSTAENLIALLEKFTMKQIKIIYEFQDLHPVSFVRFVPTALDFTFNFVFHEGATYIFTNSVLNFRIFAIHCINLMKSIMLWSRSKSNETKRRLHSNTLEGVEYDKERLLNNFFTSERLTYICDKIITHYFLLTQMELDNWHDDPEGFAQEDASESWKYALTPSIEKLYLTCFSMYQKQMAQQLLKFVHKAQALQLTENAHLKDVLLKDAIYKAVGLPSFFFYDEIDLDAWFNSQLLAEIKLKNANFRILRRRIVWLLGEFLNVKETNCRPLAYEVCHNLMGRQEDMMVRLEASRTLNKLITDYGFTATPFLPYLKAEMDALFLLLTDAKECDTKMNVLGVMSSIVETMSDHMKNEADNLIAYLPMLWKESEDHNMLRFGIIGALQQLVKAFRNIPSSVTHFLYSVIEISTNLQKPDHIYLMEEGLLLWLCVVENTTTLSSELLELGKMLLPIIEMSTENMRCVLMLIQAYVLLDASMFLNLYGEAFVKFCLRMFDDIRDDGAILMLKVFDTCLRADANQGLQYIQAALHYIFNQVYLNDELPMLMTMYLTILARVALIDAHVFHSALQTLQAPNALETIFQVWIDKLPLVTETDKRKLFCISLSSLFLTNTSFICDRLPAILLQIAETLREVMEEEETSECESKPGCCKYVDSLVFVDEHSLDTSSFCAVPDFNYENDHYNRLRGLTLKDPVHKIHLDQCVAWQLKALRTHVGVESFQRALAAVPATTMEMLTQYVSID